MSNTYDFGGPLDYLDDIHFPSGHFPPGLVQPWFWYLKQQGPIEFFSFLAPQGGWGPGWVRRAILPVIKILPIDTQPEVPTTSVGFGTLEDAIDRTNAGEPISQDAWGRFYFAGPKADKWWWKVVTGRDPANGAGGTPDGLPEYTIVKGCPQQRVDPRTGLAIGRDLPTYFRETVEHWRDCWNSGAELFNAAAAGVSPGGTYTCILPFNGGFEVAGVNPGESIPELSRRVGVDQYLGAVPITEVFEPGQALIIKQAWAFTMEVAQLDPFEWDFTSFPPRRASDSGRPPFAITHDARANNPSILAGILPPFPQNSPILT